MRAASRAMDELSIPIINPDTSNLLKDVTRGERVLPDIMLLNSRRGGVKGQIGVRPKGDIEETVGSKFKLKLYGVAKSGKETQVESLKPCIYVDRRYRL